MGMTAHWNNDWRSDFRSRELASAFNAHISRNGPQLTLGLIAELLGEGYYDSREGGEAITLAHAIQEAISENYRDRRPA